MELVSNVRVYGVRESIIASGYSMRSEPPTEEEFDDLVKVLPEKHVSRATTLSSNPKGSGHDNFLSGCLVQFDLCFTVKVWTEAELYHFFQFVTSMSTMHRLNKMDLDLVFCDYVADAIKDTMKQLKDAYNENPTEENFLSLVYSCPVGLKLTARMSTNYLQLKTIYSQRKNHRLPEWREFCEWIKTLPYSEFIVGGDAE
ncbi:MAG: hypothetical protein OSJ43_06195 [Oscillospiraceae bacterium]|nr:hypothetical protein [Oscillospiraceae bacterium]